MEDAYRDIEYDEMMRILKDLPEELEYLRESITRDDFTISGCEELIQEYLSNPPGHHESDDDDSDGTADYSPIDAIFER